MFVSPGYCSRDRQRTQPIEYIWPLSVAGPPDRSAGVDADDEIVEETGIGGELHFLASQDLRAQQASKKSGPLYNIRSQPTEVALAIHVCRNRLKLTPIMPDVLSLRIPLF